jgi:hypothetical protein
VTDYTDGFTAAQTGEAISTCPYAPADPAGLRWRQGWIEGEARRRLREGTFGATAEEHAAAIRSFGNQLNPDPFPELLDEDEVVRRHEPAPGYAPRVPAALQSWLGAQQSPQQQTDQLIKQLVAMHSAGLTPEQIEELRTKLGELAEALGVAVRQVAEALKPAIAAFARLGEILLGDLPTVTMQPPSLPPSSVTWISPPSLKIPPLGVRWHGQPWLRAP